MEKTIDEVKQIDPSTKRVFMIGIHQDQSGILVRKSEVIFGLRVPIDQTYVLDPATAIWMQQVYANQVSPINLN